MSGKIDSWRTHTVMPIDGQVGLTTEARAAGLQPAYTSRGGAMLGKNDNKYEEKRKSTRGRGGGGCGSSCVDGDHNVCGSASKGASGGRLARTVGTRGCVHGWRSERV